MTRTKLLGLAAAVLGILVTGMTLLPIGNAQEQKKPTIPATGGGGASRGGEGGAGGAMSGGGSGRTSSSPAWEYKYVIRKSGALADFRNELSSHSRDGWEYVGTETLTVTEGDKSDLGSAPILVFKRPAGGGRSSMSMTGAETMGGMGMGGFPKQPGAGFGGQPAGFSGFGGASNSGRSGGRGAEDPFAGTSRTTPAGGSSAAKRTDPQILPLKHTAAVDLAKTLQELFQGTSTRIVPEQHSNSLLIDADRTTIDAIKKLLEKLDVPPARGK